MDFTKLLDYGLVGIIIAALGIALYRAGSYIAAKLFDDDKGYCSKLVNAHLDFVNKTAQASEKQTAILGELRSQAEQTDKRLVNLEQIQTRTVSILDKLTCSNIRNGSAPKSNE